MIEFYAKKAGTKPFTSHILETQPKLDIKAVRKVQRQYWTAFKHAAHQHSGKERGDDELLSRFSDEQNDTALFIGWYDYALVTNTMPIEAQVHQIWYIVLNLHKLDPKHSKRPYQKLFPRLRAKSRAEQKRMLNETIERARADKNVMSDPRTDTRALILGWPGS